MHTWQLQEAKAKLTQLIKEAQKKPQIISRHGVNEVVVMSMKEYKEAFEKEENFVTFLRNSPLCGLDLSVERDQSTMREINLDDE